MSYKYSIPPIFMAYTKNRISSRNKKTSKKRRPRPRPRPRPRKTSKRRKAHFKKGGNNEPFEIRRPDELTGEADEIQVLNLSTISNGANGMVYKIEFEYNNRPVSEHNYNKKKTDIPSDAREFALKIPTTSKGQITDNIMFEYIAGMYINKLLSSFTSFIKTERLFLLDIDEHQGESTIQEKSRFQNTAKNVGLYDPKNRVIKLRNIEDSLVPIPSDIDQSLSDNLFASPNASMVSASCQLKDKYALLLQYFEGSTLKNMFLDQRQEIPPDVLFQLYAPLYAIGSDNLRHLDLHSGNVLIQTLPVSITFVYYFNDPQIVHSGVNTQGSYEETPAKEVIVNTKYLVKIVDYGRAYTGHTKHFLDQYENLKSISPPERRKIYEHNMRQCGLIHILRNQNNTTEGVDLRYIVKYPNYLWALNTQLPDLSQTSTNFQIHIDCRKYYKESDRPSKYYTGTIPPTLKDKMDLFGIISPENGLFSSS